MTLATERSDSGKSQAPIQVAAYVDARVSNREDALAVEEPLEIQVVAGPSDTRMVHNIAVTMRTPGADFELALGFLLTEGALARTDQVVAVDHKREANGEAICNVVQVSLAPETAFDAAKFSRHVFTSSSCGICGRIAIERVRAGAIGQPTGGPIAAATLLTLPEKLREAQRVFAATGGLHASALFDLDGRFLLAREDVGRHNALDKLIGCLFREKRLPASDTALLLSGRASFELIQKAAIAGVPIVAAVGAPSSLAVSLAQEFGMTLVGFLKENRFNVYAGRERIAGL